MKKVYQANQDDIFVGETYADEDPLTPGEFLIPAGCYEDSPGELGEHQAAKRNSSKTAWDILPDFVGTTYWLADGTSVTISVLGEAPPADSFEEKPVTLAEAVERQSLSITRACANKIVSGFLSDALSSEETTHYPSTVIDQLNLQAETTLAMISSSDPAWTTLVSVKAHDGTWSKQPHTAAQVIKVSQDFSKFRTELIAKKDDYLVEIAAADTVEEVFAVIWN